MTVIYDRTIEWRSSAAPAYEQCGRRSVALAMPRMVRQHGYQLRPVRRHIGASIGTGAHVGQAHLMTEFQKSGEVGGRQRVDAARELAVESLRKDAEEELTLDDVTPSIDAGAKQLHAMMGAYHGSIWPDVPPVLVERGLKMTVTVGEVTLLVTGHVDLFMVDKIPEDLKTGRHTPKSIAQFGSYMMLLRSNGFLVGPKFRQKYMPRMPVGKPQPPPDIREFPQGLVETHAMHVLRRIARDLNDFQRTGDPSVFPAQPTSWLCTNGLCPAYDTDWCGLGALKDGKPIQERGRTAERAAQP